MELIKLATLYRTLNLYSHHAHNVIKGETFLSDHPFLSEIYNLADDYYDAIIERVIGTTDTPIDLKGIIAESYKVISKTDENYLQSIQTIIKHILTQIESLSKSTNLSQGTINLIVGQADALEVIVYKLKQRC